MTQTDHDNIHKQKLEPNVYEWFVMFWESSTQEDFIQTAGILSTIDDLGKIESGRFYTKRENLPHRGILGEFYAGIFLK